MRPPAPPRSAGACTPGGHAGARGRTEGPATSTLLLLLIQLVEYLLVPRVELSIPLLAAAGPLGQRGCAESRRPRLRLSGVEVVLVVTGSPVSETSARSRSLTLSGISTRPWFAAVTPSSVGGHGPMSRLPARPVEAESSPSPSRPARTTTPPGRQTRRSMGHSCTRHAPGARRFADRPLRARGAACGSGSSTVSSKSASCLMDCTSRGMSVQTTSVVDGHRPVVPSWTHTAG